MSGGELRALRRLRRELPAGSGFVFLSERGARMTTRGFAQMPARAAERKELMRRIQHHTISDQVGGINAYLRGHYAYYGVAGNYGCLVKVYRAVERYWHRILRSRRAGQRLTWEKYHQIKAGRRY